MSPNPQPLAVRFEAHYIPEPNSGCWLWEGATDDNGYGLIRGEGGAKSTNKLAHRVSWEIHVGRIPESQDVLHKCDNPPCVNPKHLFTGTQQDNVADMMHKSRNNNWGTKTKLSAIALKRRAQTRCKRGHLLSGANLNPKALLKGERVCRACARIRLEAFTARKQRESVN